MLQFILGKSGSGKTAWIYEQIALRVRNGERNVMLLVPDQSSFEAEKDLLELLGARLFKEVRVFGFDGLCRAVFEQTAKAPGNVIDDGTRAVLMSVAIEQLTEKRSVLVSKSQRGLTDLMLGTLRECKKNGVTADMLSLAAERVSDDTLGAKLRETALIFNAFDALVSQSYIDPLDNLDRAEQLLRENSGLFDGFVLYADSFSGFTAVQQRVLRVLLNRCSESYISLTLDPETDGSEEVFATTRQSLRALKLLAKRDSIPLKPPVRLTEIKRFANEELRVIEAQVFRTNKEPCGSVPEAVTVYTANDIFDECAYTARQIKRLVMEQGCLYSDIAVIANDPAPYRGVLNTVFDKYEIPYFMDMSRDLSVKPPVRLVNAIFRMVLDGFDREDVLAFLKTGLTRHTTEEISLFENYLYIWNISGRALLSPFTQNPRGFTDTETEEDRRRLAVIEGVRSAVTEPVLAFRESVRDKTAEEISRLLYRLLSDIGVPDALKRIYDEAETHAAREQGAEQIKVWSMLMDALDKTVACVGSMKLSPSRYYELLSIQIDAQQFMQIPQGADCVNVTTAQRVRNSTQKVSFLIGCNDGVFPAVPHTSGLFSAYELKQLSLNEVRLSDDFADLASLETFMTYSCLTSASHRLSVSCPLVSPKGEALRQSVILDELLKIFPKLRVLEHADFDSRSESMLAAAPAFEAYAASLAKGSTELNGLREFFENDDRFSEKTRALERAVNREPFCIETPENAERLFGKELTVSASQIEKFSLCRFAYFCNYGLRVRERLKADINQMEYGTLVHYILELFFTQFSKKEYSAMTDAMLSDFIRKTVDDYLAAYFGGTETKSNAFLYQLEMLCRNLLLLLRHLVNELVQSDFSVADCELNIGSDIPAYTVELPDGHRIAVCGSVDRVDVLKHDEGAYLRVVDYKTGAKEFKLSDILYGLNLQMLLYLHFIGENGRERYGEITPAGILYMPAGVPVISADGLSEEQIESKISDNYKMNGLLLDDVRVIKGMDKTESGTYIPVKIKGGSPAACKSLATLAQFGQLFKKLDLITAEMGRALYSGSVEASPVKGAHDACQYCPYDSVCAYRAGEPRNTFAVDNEKVFEELSNEFGGERDAELDSTAAAGD